MIGSAVVGDVAASSSILERARFATWNLSILGLFFVAPNLIRLASGIPFGYLPAVTLPALFGVITGTNSFTIAERTHSPSPIDASFVTSSRHVRAAPSPASVSGSRAVATTRYPAVTSATAAARPMPVEQPVINTTRCLTVAVCHHFPNTPVRLQHHAVTGGLHARPPLGLVSHPAAS